MRKPRVPNFEMDIDLVIKGVELSFEVSISKVEIEDLGYNDEFGYVDQGKGLGGFDIPIVKVYSPKKKTYVAASKPLALYIDKLFETEEYLEKVWEKVCEVTSPDPDYERDLFLGN
jgi:hypothetical protein